jgi:hypothetical protein
MDPQQYTKNRKAGKRGQGEPVQGVFHPKGDAFKYRNREDREAEYANDDGAHLVRGIGGFKQVSRKLARRKLKDRDYTKPNVEYRKERKESPFKGHSTHLVENYKGDLVPVSKHEPEVRKDPGKNNHQRLLEQRAGQPRRRR